MRYPTLKESRELLLGSLGKSVAFYSPGGNTGDRLIDAGTRELLGSKVEIRPDAPLTLVGGSGGWSRSYCSMPTRVAALEGPVVVFPSSFDVEMAAVEAFLLLSPARVFAREWRSFMDVACLHEVELAHCPSFFFDYKPWRKQRGEGVLRAYRTDLESVSELPAGNDDISETRVDLHEWLGAIAERRIVYTDRAHVMIAAALMGKRVIAREGDYFKLHALAKTWLSGYDVEFA